MKILLATIMYLTSITRAEPWHFIDNPKKISHGMEYRLHALPKNKKFKKKLYIDSYWPLFVGGIANRWQYKIDNYQLKYDILTLFELDLLTNKQVNMLSPAEKLDLLKGDLTFKTVKEEKEKGLNAETWHGYCHASAIARTIFSEPIEKIIEVEISGRYYSILFNSSDIKAIINYFINRGKHKYRQAGMPCRLKNSITCKPLNAGAFHLLITNILGIREEALFLDIDKGVEIWNVALKSYEYKLSNIGKNKVHVKTIVKYSPPDSEQNMTILEEVLETVKYEYILELNNKNEVIGGKWVSQESPDFAWTVSKLNLLKSDKEILKVLSLTEKSK